MVHPRELVEVRGPRPAGVLEALGELAPVDIPLDLDHDDAGVVVKGDDARPPATSACLAIGNTDSPVSSSKFCQSMSSISRS